MGDGGPLRVLRVREGSLRAEEGDPLRNGEGCGGQGGCGEKGTQNGWVSFIQKWSKKIGGRMAPTLHPLRLITPHQTTLVSDFVCYDLWCPL